MRRSPTDSSFPVTDSTSQRALCKVSTGELAMTSASLSLLVVGESTCCRSEGNVHDDTRGRSARRGANDVFIFAMKLFQEINELRHEVVLFRVMSNSNAFSNPEPPSFPLTSETACPACRCCRSKAKTSHLHHRILMPSPLFWASDLSSKLRSTTPSHRRLSLTSRQPTDTSPNMPQERVQKSGIAVGINKGHVRSPLPAPRIPSSPVSRWKKSLRLQQYHHPQR